MRKSLKKKIKWIFVIGFSLFTFILLLFGLFIFSVYNGVFGKLPSSEELTNLVNERASLVLSEEGELIGKFYEEDRTDIQFDQIPQTLINALIATEDVRFFEHKGIDKRSLVRVLVKTILLNKSSSGGGSTISQQLAKNLFGRQKNKYGFLTSPATKAKEAILANRLENIYSKEEILTLYLNKVPFGENVYGIESASRRFFNKSVQDLTIEEGAVFIGMLKANTTYNPRLHPENSMNRRNLVLSQMHKYKMISKQELDSLKKIPLKLDYANLESEGQADYFLSHVKADALQIIEQLNYETGSDWDILKDGLIITTTLNYELQKNAMDAFRSHLSIMQKKLRYQYRDGSSYRELMKLVNKELSKSEYANRRNTVTVQEVFDWDGFYTDSINVKDSLKLAFTLLHAGLIAINPQTGAVKAWVGGIDFSSQPYDQVLAKRQLASVFKPVLYATALEEGIPPCHLLDNTEKILTDVENWQPKNSDNSSGGRYTMSYALAHSMNIPTVNLYFQLEYSKINSLWKRMGFTETLVNKPSLSLGAAEASVSELAVAYSAFANGGYRIAPQKISSIKTADGEVLYQNNNFKLKNRILSGKTCHFINNMLQKAVKEGTAKPLIYRYNIRIPMAAKTGTSQNYSDAWLAAYNPKLVIVTRVGASSPVIRFKSGNLGAGSKLALPLVALTLKKIQTNPELNKKYYAKFTPIPAELSEMLNCPDYVEDKGLRKFFQLFKKKETTLKKETRRAKRKRLRNKS